MKQFKTYIEEKGLWDNIHNKRRRGEKMRKKGEKGAPTAAALKSAQKESMNSAIAGFSNKDGEEIKVYKNNKGYYVDASEYDFNAKDMAELKQKLKRAGANINRPDFGKLR